MKICPKCNQQVDEGARFCPACGTQLVEHVTGVAWVAGTQEEIRGCRSNETWFGIIAGLGVIMMVIPFLVSLIMTGTFAFGVLVWWAVPLGLAITVFGSIMGQHYHNKIKKLTQTLKGKPEEK